MQTCDVATEECCLTTIGASCVSTGACNGAALSCTDSANCTSGEVCCAELRGGPPKATCAATCGGGGVVLCNTSADCPNMESCDPTPLAVKVCRGGGGPGGGGGGGPGGMGGGMGGGPGSGG
jgi:hypothetical protein